MDESEKYEPDFELLINTCETLTMVRAGIEVPNPALWVAVTEIDKILVDLTERIKTLETVTGRYK